MSKYSIKLNESNRVQAMYHDDYGDPVPETAIRITDDEANVLMNADTPADYVWDNGLTYSPVHTPPSIEELELRVKRQMASLSRMEFMLRLLETTVGSPETSLLDMVETALSDPDVPRGVKIMWENASSFDRMHPEFIYFATWMGFDDGAMDGLFGIE
jgi:hypothetical protein